MSNCKSRPALIHENLPLDFSQLDHE
jgi:hypothetical protein